MALFNVSTYNNSIQRLYNVVTDAYEEQRTPTVFKSISLTTSGIIWTPATGKRFRLMGWAIDFPADCLLAAAGELLLKFQDGSGNDINLNFRAYCPNTVPANAFGDTHYSRNLPGNGWLSTAINNSLYANFSASLAQGHTQIDVWGTEE